MGHFFLFDRLTLLLVVMGVVAWSETHSSNLTKKCENSIFPILVWGFHGSG